MKNKLVAILIISLVLNHPTYALVGSGEYVTVNEVKDWYATMSNILKVSNDYINSVLEKNTKAKELHDRAMEKDEQ